MNVYVYDAELYCEDCANEIKRRLAKHGELPENPEDEDSYDSDEYPRGPYSSDEYVDCPEHCSSGPDCLNPLELNGEKYGAWLENLLTEDGVRYVKQYGDKNTPLTQFWLEMYADQL